MALNKKILSSSLAMMLLIGASYKAYATNLDDLDDVEVCHVAKYSIEKSISNINISFKNFKNSNLEKCKNEREIKKISKKIQPAEREIQQKIDDLSFTLDGVKRCVEGDDSACNQWASNCKRAHLYDREMGRSPLIIIEDAYIRLGNGPMDMNLVQYKFAPEVADIDIVMEAFENAEKEKQLAEEKRARAKEARKIERERQQAEKDMLAAQKRLEEQKEQDARNQKLRAEAEELNRQMALKQAEQEELKRLDQQKAELAALKQELEAAKIRAEMEAKNRAEAEELNRLKAKAMAERTELERLEAEKAEISILKQQMEAAQITAKEEAKNKAERDAILKEKEELRLQEAQKQAKLKAEQENIKHIDDVIMMLTMQAAPIITYNELFKQQLEFGTPSQKRQAKKALSYTEKIIDLLQDSINVCNEDRKKGYFARCNEIANKKATEAGFLLKELEEKIESF